MTAYTEGNPIDRVEVFKEDQRGEQVYAELAAAAEELLRLADSRRGKTDEAGNCSLFCRSTCAPVQTIGESFFYQKQYDKVAA